MNNDPKIQFLVLSPGDKVKNTLLHNRIYASNIATFAMDLMKMQSMPIIPDGETSTGHAQTRILTPEEVVKRCVSIAELAYDAFSEKAWSVEAEHISELLDASEPPGFRPTKQNGRTSPEESSPR